ncbi:MAG: hypothetical protein IT521_07340 [Burkholderiales bacterium]|nr:hypothetical protein [Burkholderiales bacterium]
MSSENRQGRGTVAWSALFLCAIAAGSWLRLRGLSSQIIIDDEWHALRKLMRADMLNIVSHLDYADYSIPLTVYYRWLQDTIGISEWGMHLPMLVAGIALIIVGPWLARAWTTAPVRATWALLLALSPLLVYVSRTARPYALTALSTMIAIIAFERWWRAEGNRDAWAAAYVAATFAGGYLHMTSLAFTLAPFIYFGARVLTCEHGQLRRLLRMGVATALPLALVLLPPVINDWFSFAAKAGVDSVTVDSFVRTSLMLAGSAQAIVAVLLAICAAVGALSWWRRDRLLAGYVLTVAAVGTLAVLAARPNWVMHPPVLARYLVPILPLMLLLAAEGVIALVPRRPSLLQAPIVALLAVGLWTAGPLPALSRLPNQFTGHLRYQFDYDALHNPYEQQAAIEPVPEFYRRLALAPAGSLTLIEAPWRLESHFNPHPWYQEIHRQNVIIGLTTPLCGVREFGEYPEGYPGFRFAHFAHLSAILRGRDYGADYLVMHVLPWSAPAGDSARWPDVARCLPAIEAALGPPVFRDEQIVVFKLPRKNSAGSTPR